jgi:hypothetical protein
MRNQRVSTWHDAYDLVSWTPNVITAQAKATLRVTNLILDLRSESVRLVSTSNNDANDVRTLRFVSGSEVSYAGSGREVYHDVYSAKDFYDSLLVLNSTAGRLPTTSSSDGEAH